MGLIAPRLICQQHLEHHGPGPFDPLADGVDLHARQGCPDTGGGEDPLALDLDHAGTTVAVRPVTRSRVVAQMGNLRPLAARHVPEGLSGDGVHRLAIKREADRRAVAHSSASGK
jgi:hypothetical protein